MVGHTANLLSLVGMKYGLSNMADKKWQKQCLFFKFNPELWAVGICKGCQNSATAVRNYICRTTRSANLVPVYPHPCCNEIWWIQYGR